MRRCWFFIFPLFLGSCPMALRHAMAGPVGRCDGMLSLLAGHREITGGGDRCGRSGRDSIPRAAAELQAQQFRRQGLRRRQRRDPPGRRKCRNWPATDRRHRPRRRPPAPARIGHRRFSARARQSRCKAVSGSASPPAHLPLREAGGRKRPSPHTARREAPPGITSVVSSQSWWRSRAALSTSRSAGIYRAPGSQRLRRVNHQMPDFPATIGP